MIFFLQILFPSFFFIQIIICYIADKYVCPFYVFLWLLFTFYYVQFTHPFILINIRCKEYSISKQKISNNRSNNVEYNTKINVFMFYIIQPDIKEFAFHREPLLKFFFCFGIYNCIILTLLRQYQIYTLGRCKYSYFTGFVILGQKCSMYYRVGQIRPDKL